MMRRKDFMVYMNSEINGAKAPSPDVVTIQINGAEVLSPDVVGIQLIEKYIKVKES